MIYSAVNYLVLPCCIFLAFCWTCLNIKALDAIFVSAESLNTSALSSILAGTSNDFGIKHKFPFLNALATLFFVFFF